MVYCNTHRSFLQAMYNRGSLSKLEAFTIFSEIWKSFGGVNVALLVDSDSEENDNVPDPTFEDFEDAIKLINEKILELDQKIVQTNYEPLQETFFVFVTTADSAINKIQSTYTQGEIDYFYLVVNAIAVNDDSCISPIECLNLCTQITQKILTKTRGEELLEEWSTRGYFSEIKGKIYFGPKFIIEFGNYMKLNFADNIVICNLCKIIVYTGVKCEKCDGKFHLTCIRKYLARVKTCPLCKDDWTTNLR